MGKRLTQQQFEEKVYKTFEGKYSVISEYLGQRKPVTLHCNIHNIDFTATAECFTRQADDTRSSCPECTAERRREKKIILLNVNAGIAIKFFIYLSLKQKIQKVGYIFVVENIKIWRNV